MTTDCRPQPARGTPTLDGLIAAFSTAPDLRGAACKGEAPLFDLDHDEAETWSDRKARHDLARSICRACPALAACTDWAASIRPRSHLRGVIAGRVHNTTPPRTTTTPAIEESA